MRSIYIFLWIAVLGISGCNLFSPFHSEGEHSDPDVLRDDAEAALAREDPEQALQYLDKALEQKPDDPDLLYLHAVAVVDQHDMDLSLFLDAFQKNGVTALLEGSEAELGDLLETFWQVGRDLSPLVDGLSSGTLTIEEVPQVDDVLLSYSLAQILTGLLLILDEDHTPPQFTPDPRIQIDKVGSAYQVHVEDPGQTDQEIDHEVDALITAQWPRFMEGRQGLWLYYQWVRSGVPPHRADPLPELPAPLSVDFDDSPAGIILSTVDQGLRALWEEMQD